MTDIKAKRLALLITSATPSAAYAPWMMAATAAAMGYECKLFYAFDGLALLRPEPVLSAALDAAQGSFPDMSMLRDACLEQGVEMLACSTSLAASGLAQADLLPEAEVAGMASWLVFASGAEIQLNFG
jgi:predicted peroxiredoxin